MIYKLIARITLFPHIEVGKNWCAKNFVIARISLVLAKVERERKGTVHLVKKSRAKTVI